jgi:uncharacterized protein
MPHGKFAWNELLTNDLEKAKAFYAATLGWTLEQAPPPNAHYWLAKFGGEPVAGMMDATGMLPPGVPPHWLSYIEVDDTDARAKQVAANGGKVMREPFDIAGVGRIAIVADATGAALGLMTWQR